jgi:hypothetical protein
MRDFVEAAGARRVVHVAAGLAAAFPQRARARRVRDA